MCALTESVTSGDSEAGWYSGAHAAALHRRHLGPSPDKARLAGLQGRTCSCMDSTVGSKLAYTVKQTLRRSNVDGDAGGWLLVVNLNGGKRGLDLVALAAFPIPH
jgi:hypothetical protein